MDRRHVDEDPYRHIVQKAKRGLKQNRVVPLFNNSVKPSSYDGSISHWTKTNSAFFADESTSLIARKRELVTK